MTSENKSHGFTFFGSSAYARQVREDHETELKRLKGLLRIPKSMRTQNPTFGC